jgi:hypothetical protein
MINLNDSIQEMELDYVRFLTINLDGSPTGLNRNYAKQLFFYASQTTKEICLGAPRLIAKALSGGVVLPGQMEEVLSQLSQSATHFYKKCQDNAIDSILIFHPPSIFKTDVGYLSQEILTTLGYAANDDSTHLISIVKESAGIRVPRGFVKQNIGTKDMKKASGQAKNNLEKIMEPGQFGPFPFYVKNPIFYFDESQAKKFYCEPINLATGHPNVSITMHYNDVVDVLKNEYKAKVKICKILNS